MVLHSQVTAGTTDQISFSYRVFIVRAVNLIDKHRFG